MASSNGYHRDMTLMGISDTELLAIVDDVADEDGWAMTTVVRLQLGENPDEHGKSGVGTRLAWMRRYGWLEGQGTGSKADPKRWRLTAVGHALIENPKLAKGVEASLAKLSASQRLVVAREIAEAGAQSSAIRDALRRQWSRSIARPR
jgi:hypothetical protein